MALLTVVAGGGSAHTGSADHGTLTFHDEPDGQPQTGTTGVDASVQASCTVWVRGYGMDHANGTIEAEHGTLLEAHVHTAIGWNATRDADGGWDFQAGPFTLHEGGEDWTVWASAGGHGTEKHDLSYEICEEEPTPPTCPRQLRIRAHAATEVSLRWNASAEADTFIVYRSIPGEDLGKVAEVESTSFVDTQVEANTSYRFRVTAFNEHGEAEGCPIVDVRTPELRLPRCPLDVRVHLTSSGVAALTWNVSADAHAGAFLVLRATDGDRFEKIARVNGTSFVDVNLRLGTHHAYRVVGVNVAGEAQNCKVVDVGPGERSQPPACPANVQANAQESGEIRLTWEAAEDADTYHVYRATEASSFEHVAETGSPSYVDSDTEVDQTYRYRVTAANEAGEAEGCRIVEATAIPFFAEPALLGLALLGSVGAVTIVRRDR